jgi:hypothetical protein
MLVHARNLAMHTQQRMGNKIDTDTAFGDFKTIIFEISAKIYPPDIIWLKKCNRNSFCMENCEK